MVSDSQVEELKSNQRQEEIDDIDDSRKRLEDSYQVRIKVLNQRQNEIKRNLRLCLPQRLRLPLISISF